MTQHRVFSVLPWGGASVRHPLSRLRNEAVHSSYAQIPFCLPWDGEADGHLAFFPQVLAAVDNAAVIICFQVSLCGLVVLLVTYPGAEMLGPMVAPCLPFREPARLFQRGCVPLQSHQPCGRAGGFDHSTTFLHWSCILASPVGGKRHLAAWM